MNLSNVLDQLTAKMLEMKTTEETTHQHIRRTLLPYRDRELYRRATAKVSSARSSLFGVPMFWGTAVCFEVGGSIQVEVLKESVPIEKGGRWGLRGFRRYNIAWGVIISRAQLRHSVITNSMKCVFYDGEK